MDGEARRNFFGKLAGLGGILAFGATRAQAQTPAASAGASVFSKQIIKRAESQPSGYSQAIITEGGKTIYLAGHATDKDASGKSLVGDFHGQVLAVFAFMEDTLKQSGGKLSDLVSLTCFITDPRYHKILTQTRHDLLGDNFPVSAVIGVSHLATPDLLLEIQGIAVIRA
jgi:2-iminobutanoate/2-iminopropanoate deaminase